MNNSIRTYRDLLDEKERLQALLKIQREQIAQDFHEIGERLGPVKTAVSFAGKLFTRDEDNVLVNLGAGALIEIIFKKLLLSRAGWLTRLIVPYFLKNFTSHLSGKTILKSVFSRVGKKNANGKEKKHRH